MSGGDYSTKGLRDKGDRGKWSATKPTLAFIVVILVTKEKRMSSRLCVDITKGQFPKDMRL